MMAALAIILVVVGLALIVAEAFLPSGGILTVMAIVAAGVGVVLAFVHEGPLFGGVLVAVTLILGPSAFLYGLSRLPHSRFGSRLVLRGRRSDAPATATDEVAYEALVGRDGQAATSLRPAGMATIDGRRLDVVTEGGIVRKGTRVRVIDVEGNRVVVRPIEEAPSA